MSYRKTVKRYGKDKKGAAAFAEVLAGFTNDLVEWPTGAGSDPEPLPDTVTLPAAVMLRKIRFQMPRLSGAVGQGRYMYLVDTEQALIIPLWVYTHADYRKRPPPRDLVRVIKAVTSLADPE